MAKVIVIEDENSILEVYKELLESEGHTVQTALDGEVGLDLALNSEWDIMFLDIMLPKLDGYALLQRLVDENQISEPRSVIMITNLVNDDVVEKCLGLGAKEYVVKSEITPQKIIDVVNNYTANAENARA